MAKAFKNLGPDWLFFAKVKERSRFVRLSFSTPLFLRVMTANTAEYLPVDGTNSGVGDEVAYTLTIDNNGTLTLFSVTPAISEVNRRFPSVETIMFGRTSQASCLVGN